LKIVKYDLASTTAILLILLAIVVAMSAPERLAYSLVSITKDIAIFTLVGMAQMVTLSVGQFNLAVGAIGGAAGMVCGFLINVPTAGKMAVENYVQAEIGAGIPWVIGILLAMIVGLLLGAMQGGIIVKTKINPFIISLSLISVFHGINMAVTENIYFRKLPDGFKQLSTLTIPPTNIAKGGMSTYGVPIILLIAFCMMVVMWVIYSRTTLGRKLLATGISRRAADFAGIPSGKYITIAHAISGLLCAFAGVLTASKLGAAQTSIGDNWLLYSFAAPILGGTLLSGGKVSIVGTMIGAAIMTVTTTVLALLKLDAFTHQIFIGSILLLSYLLNKVREQIGKKQEKTFLEPQEIPAAVGGNRQ
jgi:ribose transport system permease protein